MGNHFFVVGIQRSGTTYLHRILDEHPDIEMAKPVRPEPKFFLNDALYERGLDYYKSRFFENQERPLLFGEKSTSYAESEKVAERLARCFPEAKIIFLLRDPIERAVSHYFFSLAHGIETLPMREAFLEEEHRWQDFDRERISVSPYAYMRRGRYIENILLYQKYFPPDNIAIFLFERLIGSITEIQALYAFLGVASFLPPSLLENINPGTRPEGQDIPEDLRDFLVQYFWESNNKLREEFGLDLSCWQNFEEPGLDLPLQASVREH